MVLLAVSVVMAGSGKVLQLCRFLHKHTCGEMNYVFHMPHHVTLGLLFLGTHSAIAALLCALYPHFPAHSSDNRYHLLALRHLAVFAAEPHLLVSVDVDTVKPCYALLDLTYRETQWYEETTVELMAPTMLPELHLLKRIKVKGPRYWELNIDISKGTQHLQSILSKDGVLYVKLHAGQLPNKDDPKDWKSLLAPNLNNRSAKVRTLKPEAISTFTSDAALVSFASENMKHKLSAILYECVTQEYPEMLPTHISIDQITVMCYLRRQPMNNDTDVNMLACFLVYHSIPSLKNMVVSDLKGCSCFPELLLKSSQLGVPVRALLRLSPLLLQKHDSGV